MSRRHTGGQIPDPTFLWLQIMEDKFYLQIMTPFPMQLSPNSASFLFLLSRHLSRHSILGRLRTKYFHYRAIPGLNIEIQQSAFDC